MGYKKYGGASGEKAEEQFKLWLDKHNIPYWYIQQDMKTFSKALGKYFGAKRPDFMILVPNLSFLFVDIKEKKTTTTRKDFPMDILEAKQHSSLQRNFNIPVWYAVSNEGCDYKTWFWIPVSKVLEEGNKEFISSRSGQPYSPITLDNFIQIAHDDSLDRLFSKCFANVAIK